MAVKTTRTVSRGFERERKAEKLRRRDRAGCLAATVVRTDEASGGKTAAPVVEAEGEAAGVAFRRGVGRVSFGEASPATESAGVCWAVEAF
jgi:hypothetical protein